MEAEVAFRVGSKLAKEFRTQLADYCQIKTTVQRTGESIVQAMIFSCANKAFKWPVLIGRAREMTAFWKHADDSMGDEFKEHRDTNLLEPVRLLRTEKNLAKMCVNAWWLLLVAAMAGNIPSQNSVNVVSTHLTNAFFEKCVPNG